MTKTAKILNHGTKKPLKSGKVKPPVVKKKVVISKEQEAAIAETISFVIKNKLSKKPDALPLKKKATASAGEKCVSKSPKKSVKDASAGTAKKTTPSPTRISKKKDTHDEPSTATTTAMANKSKSTVDGGKKAGVKRVNKSPTGRPAKQDNKGEIKEGKADAKSESKQITPAVAKVKQEKNESKEKERKIDGAEKVTACKDNKDKKEMSDKEKKDKKDAEKLIKEKKSDSHADKSAPAKEKSKKKPPAQSGKDKPPIKKVVTKETLTAAARKKLLAAKQKKVACSIKAKQSVKKQIAIKVKPKKQTKPSVVVAKKKINSSDVKKDDESLLQTPSAETSKEAKCKATLKTKIKEEQVDEEPLLSENKGVANKQDTSKETDASTSKEDTVKKPKKVPVKDLKKKKLKAKLHTSSLKASTVVVKKQNQKPKLVTKPIQQVKCRKLVSMWNGPKRHRVASLNAIAKVHCLYENESRANFEGNEPPSPVKREPKAAERKSGGKSSSSDREDTPSPQPTRTLRSLPGLRVYGKMWDMHDTSSSSSEEFSSEPEEKVKPKKSTAPPATAAKRVARKPMVRRRKKKEEVVMDLKDMVVRKRMASLNASAILAASYSVEKRARNRDSDTDTTETTTSDEDEVSDAASDIGQQLKKLDALDIKKEVKEEKLDRQQLIEMRAAGGNNKNKVAVILNQDTDVTFTGVYVNSTTRSTHHEGYCRIAGMQYRISATSHTQTAATAVATETILQSSTTTTTHENENAEPSPVKSYTPLDALSNMQPPANSGGALPAHHHLQPPPPPHHIPSHVVGGPSELSSLTRRHGGGCSAFSAPPGGCGPQVHHHHIPPEHHPYVTGYYQPAGPLISVHGHSQAPPPPTLTGKVVQLPDASPVSTPPLLQPPPPSSAGDSSDSEVIITSVTTAKEAIASQQLPQPPTAYRLNHHYPPPPPSHSAYPPYGPYPPQYYSAPPPPQGPPYSHHDMCYTSFPPHKYMFRRYLPPAPPYYQPASPDIYGQPPNSTNQQVVVASSTASGSYQSSSTGPPPPTLMEPYPGAPPTLIESYPPPPHYYSGYGPAPPCYTHSHSPPARPLNFINATYQPCPCPMQSCPKNVHTGPLAGDSKRSNIIAKESVPLPPVALALPLEPASATGPPSPARGSAGMPPPPSPAGATYQQPPAPPKQETPEPAAEHNHVEKRRKARVGKAMVRNTIAQNQNTMLLMCQTQQMHNVSATILSNVKREVESPQEENNNPGGDLKKDTRLTLVPEIVQQVPAEVELTAKAVQKVEPREHEHHHDERKHENNIKCEKPETPPTERPKAQITEVMLAVAAVPETCAPVITSSPSPTLPLPEVAATTVTSASPAKLSPTLVTAASPQASPTESLIATAETADNELLLPCQKTVAENVKVKNMKRKLSCSKDQPVKAESPAVPAKTQKVVEKANGTYKSYKDLIKKTQNVVKINNGRRKLISESMGPGEGGVRLKKNNKRKLAATAGANKEDNAGGKRLKSSKPLTDSNVLTNSKQSVKESKAIVDPELIENKEPTKKALKKQPAAPQVHNKSKKTLQHNNGQANGTTTATTTTTIQGPAIPITQSPPTALSDNNNKLLSNIDRIIESVVNNVRVNNKQVVDESGGALRTESGKVDCEPKKSAACNNAKKSTNKAAKAKKIVADAAATTAVAAPVRRSRSKEVPQVITRVPRRSVQLRWSNGWRWHGEPFDGKVFLNSDEATVMRKCYPAMVHDEGDIIELRDCVLLKAGQRKNELPFVAKIAALWENPDDGEMMMSLLWYYRPEHTEQGRRPVDQPDEVFASRHKDSNSVACIEDKCYVLTYNEYCRYRKDLRRHEFGIEDTGPCIPIPDDNPRQHRHPPSTMGTSADLVFFCRKVYDFRQKRIIKNPS